AMYTSLAFGPDHRPYVAFRDGANGYKATVMAYNGASWNLLGPAGFSDGRADFTTLIFSYAGTPIIGYEDFNVGGKATVKQFVVNTGGVDKKETSSLSIFPNPASERVYFNLKNVSGINRNIQVYDLTGKKMADLVTSDSEISINVESYPSGLYFVKVISDQSNLTGKFFRK
ncbi:MAG: T9SS type A sorting domain-containing protein, partial [Bacteroidota bacterium]